MKNQNNTLHANLVYNKDQKVGIAPIGYDPASKLIINGEIWKPVKGYEDYYQISNLGRLVSLNYKGNGYRKLLKTNINKNGYEQVRLNVNKIGKNKKIHRLVAEAFLLNSKNKKCVNHKDSNRLNRGWDMQKIIETPINKKHTKK